MTYEPRYQANEVDAMDHLFDRKTNDDPSNEELRKWLKEGIDLAVEDVRKYLYGEMERLMKEARSIFDECLLEAEE